MADTVKIAKIALIGIGSLATLTLAGNVAFGFGGKLGQEAESSKTDRIYTIVEQAPLTANGKISSNVDKGYFANNEKGQVSRIYVQNGQYVKKGDPLFEYVDSSNQTKDAVADLLEEQTNLYNQRIRLIRQRKKLTGKDYNYAGYPLDANYVYGKGDTGANGVADIENETVDEPTDTISAGENDNSSSGSQVATGKIDYSIPSTGDPAIDQVNSAIKEVEKKLLRAKRDQKPIVYADYDGFVYVNEEGVYNSQVPLVRLVAKELVINSSISEYDYARLKRDKKVKIYVKAEDRTVKGHVSAVDELPNNMATANSGASQSSGDAGKSAGQNSSAIDATTYGFQVVPDKKVHIGYSVSLEIPVDGYDVPATALKKKSGQYYVMKIVNGKVKQEKVSVEKRGINLVVMSGLKKGDRILTDAHSAKDGDQIDDASQAK